MRRRIRERPAHATPPQSGVHEEAVPVGPPLGKREAAALERRVDLAADPGHAHRDLSLPGSQQDATRGAAPGVELSQVRSRQLAKDRQVEALEGLDPDPGRRRDARKLTLQRMCQEVFVGEPQPAEDALPQLVAHDTLPPSVSCEPARAFGSVKPGQHRRGRTGEFRGPSVRRSRGSRKEVVV